MVAVEGVAGGGAAGWRLDQEQDAAAEPTPGGRDVLIGGPGTGKTVVALHRIHRTWRACGVGRLLLTTGTPAAVGRLADGLVRLGGREILDRVDVLDVDVVARQTCVGITGRTVRTEPDEAARWAQVLQRAVELDDADRRRYTPEFLAAEYRLVIVGRDLRRREDYLACSRSDRGVALDGPERTRVWGLVTAFEDLLARRGTTSRDRTAARAAEFAEAARDPGAPRIGGYRHVVGDAAHEFSPTQLRLLRALVVGDTGSLLLCGDDRQRVHAQGDVLSAVAASWRRLRLGTDHRSSRAIVDFATSVLDPDEESPGAGGAGSTVDAGPEPITWAFDSTTEERDAVVRVLRRWRTEVSVDEPPCAVLTPSARLRDHLDRRLRAARVGTVLLGSEEDIEENRAVRVGELASAAGREFSRVAVSGVGAESVPPAGLADRVDPGDRPEMLRRWRALLYVACTRARDRLLLTWTGEPSPFLPRLPARRKAPGAE
ncbi:superfamily I DNA/RNA helicase [Actinoalloteichus hoggarensis]|uniref:DNA-dependent helicase II n=1 Tax=Actinoalloteichus hoggarensis TaxID=1470176 RepID=A0A221VW46_9PSEU|nr:UvrD-helicase domain-containing protein [Actinoalloteichus hoggarensis]ASO17770.1 DNA-dependent helicase II [Actinoalloteichus hoggarensis]MBB5922897.1 superfamily I DNA/RNA helicase [Actinoalloteichus hoggarensis]